MLSLKQCLNDIVSAFNKGIVTEKLLWEHDSPSSGFNYETISLDLNDYDAVRIEYLMASSGKTDGISNLCYVFSRTCPIGESCVLDYILSIFGTTATPSFAGRRATVSTSDVYIGVAQQKGGNQTTGTSRTDLAVPYRIYGIKHLGGS